MTVTAEKMCGALDMIGGTDGGDSIFPSVTLCHSCHFSHSRGRISLWQPDSPEHLLGTPAWHGAFCCYVSVELDTWHGC